MKDKLNLYKTFIELLGSFGKTNGLAIKEVRKIMIRHFKAHPHFDELSELVKDMTKARTDLDFLLDECIRLCDELGPSREYFTLINLFENITQEFAFDGKPETEAISKKLLENFKNEIALINQKIPQPPLFNMLLESRSLVEWTSIYAIYPFIPKRIKGEGRPVLLIPPYLGDDYSTSFVRRYLTSLGFKTYKWDQGFNLVKSHYIPRLEEKCPEWALGYFLRPLKYPVHQ